MILPTDQTEREFDLFIALNNAAHDLEIALKAIESGKTDTICLRTMRSLIDQYRSKAVAYKASHD